MATTPARVISGARAAYSTAQDRYLVVFSRQWLGNDWDVLARIVPDDGTAPTGPWLPIATDLDMQTEPAIAYNSQADEFLVAWTNAHDVGGPNADYTVKMRRVRASDGSLVGQTRSVPGSGLGVARLGPALAYNRARNQYLIAYIAEAAAPGDVRSIVAPADLSWFGSEMHVWDHTPQWHAFSACAGTARDGYLVAWNVRAMSAPAPSFELHNANARQISGAGVPLGAASGIPITAAALPFDLRHVTDVAYAPGYGYLVALSYLQSTASESDTYAAFVLSGATTAGSPFAIDVAATHAWGPVAACTPRGVCLLAETYRLNAGWSKADIRARFLYLRRLYLPVALKATG